MKRYESKVRDQVKTLKNPNERPFSSMKVVNDIQLRHAQRHTTYSIAFDRKFLKLLNRRSYRRENLYESFRNIYQVLNATFLGIEKDILEFHQRKKKNRRLLHRDLLKSL